MRLWKVLYKMIFLQELKPYKKSYLSNLLDEVLLNILFHESICQKKDNDYITINFVGLIAYKDITISVLPKYSTTKDEKIKLENTIRLIKVFKKYEKANYRKLTSDFYPLNNQSDYNSTLGLSDLFLRDFVYYGYYEREVEEIIDDGEDEISWEDTISDVNPYFVNKQPFYLNTKNNEYKNDESNTVTAIHQNIIYDCFLRFSRLLGYEPTNILTPSMALSSLGDKTFLISVIKKEMQVVFNDQKVRLLNAMIHYLNEEYVNYNKELSLFGTKSFEYVWEYVLKKVLNDQKDKLRKMVSDSIWKKYTAFWENYLNNSVGNSDEYQPDIIAVQENSIMILDAKYYNITSSESGFKGNPGINDVAKQHIYEMIYSDIFKGCNTANALLFPNDDMDYIYKIIGRVNLGLLGKLPIILFYIKADYVFNAYINGNKFDEEILAEIFTLINETRKRNTIDGYNQLALEI
ncbi:LlaJI family restriction endonuclease [Bacillus carboniphilus]|uniref:LlaJI family restriction endonuclease n=1 Tax=Bacillus carboniphilus TaxID=86663 RepID=A0ABY9JSQ5_9BACI|nr:LlaJI family restriction endonuclease [Bacillus carboniphilus]WLR41849.1 LlaJI family restriction endonuclease [Bacillus carboniphilus]